MRQWPKVSVAILSYNQKAFLEECIQSVLIQDYPNLEIVIGDDASTDGTQEMLQTLVARYPDLIKVELATTNGGITANSNRCYFACSGEYIAWLGGDDLMLPGKLKKQAEFLEIHQDFAICYHDVEVFDSATGKTLRYFNSGEHRYNRPYEGGPEKVIQYGTFLAACSVMTRRSACPERGFDVRIPISSDWLFWIETALRGKVGFFPEVLGRYRRHSKNVTRENDCYLERLITLAIVEATYPRFTKYVRLSKARLLYGCGVMQVLDHKRGSARAVLLESLRHGWVSWKWFGWFLLSFAGTRTVNDIKARLAPSDI